jgi:hypothetical protein
MRSIAKTGINWNIGMTRKILYGKLALVEENKKKMCPSHMI